jgi:putative (di)nucleoside polyphosphate hydrolase
MPDTPAKPLLYRPNVAAILRNQEGLIFVAERIKIPGAWQFPQGGIDDGEDAETALFRELHEEIGVVKDHVRIVSQRGGYRYAFPQGRLKYGLFGGQEQTYFLCDFLGTNAEIKLDAHEQEFSQFRWIKPETFRIDWVPRFKAEVYRAVLADFFAVTI